VAYEVLVQTPVPPKKKKKWREKSEQEPFVKNLIVSIHFPITISVFSREQPLKDLGGFLTPSKPLSVGGACVKEGQRKRQKEG
jgi:hypothetical protein